MGQETELKLQLAPSDLLRLKRHPLVQRLKRGRPQTKQLKSVYFDGEDFRLRSSGVALRVRHVGRRRIQTPRPVRSGPGLLAPLLFSPCCCGWP